LGLVPEHCFKAGDSRGPRAAGHHTQTYWLAPVPSESWPDPIEPAFLAEIAARRLDRNVTASAEDWLEAAQSLRARSVEVVLLHFLTRLSVRHAFLQQVQSEAGDVSLIMLIEHESATDFTLPLAVARLLVQLGISIEFRFT
jgi:hypothetical protein